VTVLCASTNLRLARAICPFAGPGGAPRINDRTRPRGVKIAGDCIATRVIVTGQIVATSPHYVGLMGCRSGHVSLLMGSISRLGTELDRPQRVVTRTTTGRSTRLASAT
jgi:hypothetical protein